MTKHLGSNLQKSVLRCVGLMIEREASRILRDVKGGSPDDDKETPQNEVPKKM